MMDDGNHLPSLNFQGVFSQVFKENICAGSKPKGWFAAWETREERKDEKRKMLSHREFSIQDSWEDFSRMDVKSWRAVVPSSIYIYCLSSQTLGMFVLLPMDSFILPCSPPPFPYNARAAVFLLCYPEQPVSAIKAKICEIFKRHWAWTSFLKIHLLPCYPHLIQMPNKVLLWWHVHIQPLFL